LIPIGAVGRSEVGTRCARGPLATPRHGS
jgi:hypothetical protein